MLYAEQLQSTQWQLKRLKIIERDKHKCQNCHKSRPLFRNVWKGFGVKPLAELIENGFSFCRSAEKIKGYEDLDMMRNRWLHQTVFVGDESRPFAPERLSFVMRFDNDLIFQGLTYQQNWRLICFYPEEFTGEPELDLQVHHRYYIEAKKAWEYNDDVLVTLCTDCHQQVHKTTTINVFSEVGKMLYSTEICDRCGGKGYLPEYAYYKNGICFKCSGKGDLFHHENIVDGDRFASERYPE